MNVCLKKPQLITLQWSNGRQLTMEVPDYFEQLFFKVSDEVGHELASEGLLKGEKETA